MSDDQQHGPRPHEFHIQIDRVHYTTTANSLTGSQLRQLPAPPVGPDRDLYQVVPGAPDRKVELTDVVEIRDGLRFFTAPATINPGHVR